MLSQAFKMHICVFMLNEVLTAENDNGLMTLQDIGTPESQLPMKLILVTQGIQLMLKTN